MVYTERAPRGQQFDVAPATCNPSADIQSALHGQCKATVTQSCHTTRAQTQRPERRHRDQSADTETRAQRRHRDQSADTETRAQRRHRDQNADTETRAQRPERRCRDQNADTETRAQTQRPERRHRDQSADTETSAIVAIVKRLGLIWR